VFARLSKAREGLVEQLKQVPSYDSGELLYIIHLAIWISIIRIYISKDFTGMMKLILKDH